MGKTYVTLEHSGNDNEQIILGLQIQLKKEELDISHTFTVHQIQDVADEVKTIPRVGIAITNGSVLTKEVDAIGADHEVLSEAYPNLNLDDFYYEILKTDAKSFIAICRKSKVDEIINAYRKEKIIITEVALGNLKAASLTSFIDTDELLTHTSSITLHNTQVTAINRNTELSKHYEIQGLGVGSSHVLPLAMTLDSFSHQAKISGNVADLNQHLREQYKEVTFFKKALQYGVGFLLIALLINFFVFNSKYKKWQGLQEEIQVYTSQNESIKRQQTIVAGKEAIVNSILTTGFSKSSLYADRIIALQPTTILLSSFVYQPLAKTIRNDKPIQIKNHVISVTGNSIDKKDFTSWLNAIENLDFVTKVTIASYGVDKKNTSSFELIIQLAHDTKK